MASAMKLPGVLKRLRALVQENPKLVATVATLLNIAVLGSMFAVAVAQEEAVPLTADKAWVFMAAAITVVGACVAAGFAIHGAATAGLAAIVERPELAVWALIFGGLAEGLAIYGFVIAIIMLGKV